QCLFALGDSQHGVIVLPTALYLSKTLAKLAIDLDKRPDLIAHLLNAGPSSTDEAVEKVTLVEQSANTIEIAARLLEKIQRQREGQQPTEVTTNGNLIFDAPADADFARQETTEQPQQDADEFDDYFHPPMHFTETGEVSLEPPEAPLPAPSDTMTVDQVLKLSSPPTHPHQDPDYVPHTTEMESIVSSLLTQDLLRGYLTHKNSRFAIPGAKIRGALATGWPSVWSV
ncbi:hypothetical protein KEM56_004295, partial [Ascosphaera pollenicola]